MTEDLDNILARVASGDISAEEAEPLVAAAVASSGGDAGDAGGTAQDKTEAASDAAEAGDAAEASAPPDAAARVQRNVRLRVTERGQAVVDLRIPIGLAGLAGAMVPGLSGSQAERIRQALRSGRVGPVLEVMDERGDGVIISTE